MKFVKNLKSKYPNELLLAVILIGVFLFMGVLSPSKFFTGNNIKTMAFQMPEFGLISLGMMAAILTGGINLSITSTAALSSISAAFVLSSKFTQKNPVLGMLLAAVVCLVVAIITGIINGAVIAYVGVAAMLVTLGTMTLFEGIALNLTKGGSISGFPLAYVQLGNGSLFGIPIPLLIYALAILVSYFLLERSNWGVEVYMTGCNETATRFSGINTKKTLMKVYIFSSIMGGIAGLVLISRYNSAKVDYGSSYMMQSVAAVVLGGTSITGGHGSVAGTAIAVAIIQVVSTGLNLFGMKRYIIDIIIGGILIVVLAVRFFSCKYRDTKKSKLRAAQA